MWIGPDAEASAYNSNPWVQKDKDGCEDRVFIWIELILNCIRGNDWINITGLLNSQYRQIRKGC